MVRVKPHFTQPGRVFWKSNHVNNNKSLSVKKNNNTFYGFHENIHNIVSKQCIVFRNKKCLFVSYIFHVDKK